MIFISLSLSVVLQRIELIYSFLFFFFFSVVRHNFSKYPHGFFIKKKKLSKHSIRVYEVPIRVCGQMRLCYGHCR